MLCLYTDLDMYVYLLYMYVTLYTYGHNTLYCEYTCNTYIYILFTSIYPR